MRPDAYILRLERQRDALIAEAKPWGAYAPQALLDRIHDVECAIVWIERAHTPPQPRAPWWAPLAFAFRQWRVA